MHTEDVFTNLLLLMNNDTENKYNKRLYIYTVYVYGLHAYQSPKQFFLGASFILGIESYSGIVYLCFQNYLALI